jgi:hypothetical protein
MFTDRIMQKKEIVFFHSFAVCPRVERDAQTDEILNLEAVIKSNQ